MKKSLFAAAVLLAAACSATAFGQAKDPKDLAEGGWQYGFMVPEKLGGKNPEGKPDTKGAAAKAEILVWFPNEQKKFRAVMLVPNNTDLKPMAEWGKLREVMTKHEVAIVYERNYDVLFEFAEPGEAPNTSRPQGLMTFLAEELKAPAFTHAPWILTGKSSRGKFPFRHAWLWPERVIATMVYHGETPTWPIINWAKPQNETILHLNVNGESEWGGTWYNHVRPSLLNYRANTAWLPHIAVAKGVGHGDYANGHRGGGIPPAVPGKTDNAQVWDYISLFFDKALTLRLPKDKYPTDGPLTLNKVDESKGWVLDCFAVEETFDVPHLPLKEKDGTYVVGGGEESPVAGFKSFSPLKDFSPGEGAPVVQIESGKSPKEWLITDSLKFAMASDPMVDLPDNLRTLMPKSGDKITVDGKELEFKPIAAKHVGPNGGISLKAGLRPPNAKITLFAYTVLDVKEQATYQVGAGFTAATRVQLILNGELLKHKQVVELAPGKYPLLFVLRMEANWGEVMPNLAIATPENIELAKKQQAEVDALAAEHARLKAEGKLKDIVVVRPAAEVPAEERKRMFWMPDKEMADAWLKLHTVKK